MRHRLAQFGLWVLASVLLVTGLMATFPRTVQGQNCPFAASVALATPDTADDEKFVQCQCDEKASEELRSLVLLKLPPCLPSLSLDFQIPEVLVVTVTFGVPVKTEAAPLPSPPVPPPNPFA